MKPETIADLCLGAIDLFAIGLFMFVVFVVAIVLQ
jgi:hypothetical protein